MSRDRVSRPGTKRIDISDGDWIEVKTGLTAGEQRTQDALAYVPTRVDGEIVDRIDWTMYEFLRTNLWVTDWSLTVTIDGKTVPLPKTVDSLRNLEPEDFDEINNVVFRHIMEWANAKKARRTALLTASSSPAPLPNAVPTLQ